MESDDVVGHVIDIYKIGLKMLQDRIQRKKIECQYAMIDYDAIQDVAHREDLAVKYFIQTCEEMFQNGDYESVVGMYTTAIQNAPEPNHIYHANRANAYFQLGKYEECIYDCTQAIKIDPTQFENSMLLCQAETEKRKLVAAEEDTLTEEV